VDEPRFDHLYKYDELTRTLRDLASQHPRLMTVASVGTSYEGRDIWLATITNQDTGPHHEKPAVWVDANIHSVEHAGSVAALFLIHKLVSGHGRDAQVTHALDTRTFYVMPRVNPDGAELALAEPPTYLRSSVRPWPRTDAVAGLVEGDVDGDGRLLTMRVPDPNGAWKPSSQDARLMVARAPDDHGPGPYYRLLYEGTIADYDGATIPIAPERRSLDLNRQFPAGWRVHGEQEGAGAFPLSEPETRALAEAVVARPNICCYFAHHTFSAALLRPFDDRPDDEFPTADLRRYKQLGARGTELTGYRHVSVYHDFRYDPKDVITGGADTWAYDHLGVFAWTTEFWSPVPHAGITGHHLVDWFDDHPIDDDLALLRYNDTELGGRGFVDWYPFEHPQLGPVDIGGWNTFRFWTNPPDELLEREVAPHADWEIFCALATPRLHVRDVLVDSLGARSWRVRLVVENDGWMPTNVTQRAVDRKIAQPVVATIELPDGARLLRGPVAVELGQIAGRSSATTMVGDFGAHTDTTADRVVAEWIVEADAGAKLGFTAAQARSGVTRTTTTLS
jgi:murein tripeptide amidase MpaA